MPDPIPFDQVLAAKKAAALTLELINDTAHADRVERAKARLDTADAARRTDRSAAVADAYLDAVAELDEARAAAREATRFWRFMAIGRPAYEALLDAHQATRAQRDVNRKKQLAAGATPAQVTQVPWDTETFPAALISASLVGVFATEEEADTATTPGEPYMDLEQAQALWDSTVFNPAELDTVFSAALVVNRSNRTADLGNG